jgi:CDP-diacylglycerol--serine O-phosphatidyltransferase
MLIAILRIIPNLVTGANLFLGCVAIIQLLQFHFEAAMLCFLLALLADVLDGFLARLFRVSSSLGAQLDSLADAVTSGVLPGLMAYQLLVRYGVKSISWSFSIGSTPIIIHWAPLGLLGLVVALAAAYRLAKFNLDEDQKYDFKGLPAPANALFFMGYPFLVSHPQFHAATNLLTEPLFIVGLVVVGSLLMNAPLRMFSFKMQSNTLDSILYPLLLVICFIVLYIFFQWAAFTLAVVLYILLSIIKKVLAT